MSKRSKPKTKAKKKDGAITRHPRTPAERLIAKPLPDGGGAPFSANDGEPAPFWETKKLREMTPDEWESLCDGCGQCCLNKIEDEDTGDIYLTRLACSLLDLGACRCSDYENRFARMPDCLSIDLKAVRKLKWLPESCAYRRVHEGRGLAWWHPLVSGDPETVHQAGVSVRGWAKSEEGVPEEELARYIIGEAG